MSTYEELQELIRKSMPDIKVEDYDLDTRLVEDLKFDSLAFMMMATEIEHKYGVEFEAPVQFKTVRDVLDFVQEFKDRR